MNRKQFLRLSQGIIAGSLAGGIMGYPYRLGLLAKNSQSLSADNGKLIVPDKDSGSIVFRAQKDFWDIANNRSTNIWSFLPSRFASPLVVMQDEPFDLTLHNQLASETLGLHWHGIRLPNAMDGVPNLTQAPIALGESYRYRYTSPDAGTFWYHTHSHSLMQLRMGLVGPLIIREKKTYPADEDLIILMNDWSLGQDMKMDKKLLRNNFLSMHTANHDGLLGNIVTVNGKVNPVLAAAPNSRFRLRFINAATARIFNINLPLRLKPHLLAVDGHPVPVQPYREIALAPGMRMDIIVDIPSSDGKSQGGDGFQIEDNAYRNREKLFRILRQGKSVRSKPLSNPQSLPTNPIPMVKLNQAKRIRVDLRGGAMSGMIGMVSGMMSGMFWTINGKAMSEEKHYDNPIFQAKKGQHVLLELENNTVFSHPIHLHGHTFFILSRNGVKAKNPRPSDTIFMNAQEKAEIGFVADNPGKWMLHCHIIDHQVSGMMGFFEVG